MTDLSLKARLEKFLRAKHGLIASGDLQRIVSEATSYSPANVTRRLRELENEGKLEVLYIKNHAHYRAKEQLTFEQYWNSIPPNQQSV